MTTNNPRLLFYSTIGIISSELGRFLFNKFEKKHRKNIELITEDLIEISKEEELFKFLIKRNEETSNENIKNNWKLDKSGYDGWLEP